MRAALAVAIALAACGGDDHATIDAGPDAAALDAAAAIGTWDAPIVIAALPYTATGDTTSATEVRAERYDCAGTIDERGAEVVYRLDLAAPTIVTIAVDAAAPVDVDVHVLRGAATGPLATGCLTRDDRAFVVDLAAGSWWIAVDTYAGGAAPAAGAYTLTVDAPRSTACLTNPIPMCQAGDAPDVNGAPTPPAGLGGCPAGMARVATFCVDRWEAALVAADGTGWSPYQNPGTAAVVAVSAPGLVPQGYINQTQATAACAAAGKRLCTDTEWLRACQGAAGSTYPYGATRQPGVCNDARTCHPAVQYFQSSDSSVFSMIGHSCLDQLPDGLARTGAHAGCVSADGLYDLMGNLHEWTADPAGTFRGGFFVDTVINGNGCLYRTTAHDVSHWDYSTGFRCCADP
ncbi:MAG: SUMF1/EgtB/PvdO family nonheme iron enzyme [Kofleriaceae bacterium]|nr:SUMF1/EgtB/PvdO family nonheme iron enzyme [Kofleriaceae bacterium]